MDFANTLLQLDVPVVSLEVINPTVTPEMIQQKGIVLDIAPRGADQPIWTIGFSS